MKYFFLFIFFLSFLKIPCFRDRTRFIKVRKSWYIQWNPGFSVTAACRKLWKLFHNRWIFKSHANNETASFILQTVHGFFAGSPPCRAVRRQHLMTRYVDTCLCFYDNNTNRYTGSMSAKFLQSVVISQKLVKKVWHRPRPEDGQGLVRIQL